MVLSVWRIPHYQYTFGCLVNPILKPVSLQHILVLWCNVNPDLVRMLKSLQENAIAGRGLNDQVVSGQITQFGQTTLRHLRLGEVLIQYLTVSGWGNSFQLMHFGAIGVLSMDSLPANFYLM